MANRISLWQFAKYFAQRYSANRLPMAAGYLTYSTMLAIVPLILVVFSVFTAFPFFEDATHQLEELIYDNFAPNLGDVVKEYVTMFVANSKKMGIVSIIGLVVVAVMLIKSIDQTLNFAWRDTKKRATLPSFALYVGLLVVAPLLAGLSIAISSYLFSLRIFNDGGALSFGMKILDLAPFALTWLMFSLIYWLVPNTTVKWRHAACGALLAGVFFTLGKKAFIWYITTFPSNQAIYGALAALPIMIMWIHLSWQVVLSGGQFASVLSDIDKIKRGELPEETIRES